MTKNLFDVEPKALKLIKEQEDKENNLQRNFDKSKCIENIRTLLNSSTVRIGQIEKEAGCTAGYLSRLEKEGNKSDPSIEFICAAAKLLDVTIDTIVKGQLKMMTPIEEYLMQFISKLLEDTKSDKLSWMKETANALSKTDFNYSTQEAYHPLYEVYTEFLGGAYPEPAGTEYKSRFLSDKNLTPLGNSYNAQLPGTNERIYLMSVFDDDNIGDEILELYLVGYDVNPICATIQTCESISEAIKDLYNEVEIATSHIQISDHSKNIISQYLTGINDEDIPF